MQSSQRLQRALEREGKKLAARNNPIQNTKMGEQLGDELRTFIEHNEMTIQAFTEQNESTTQVLQPMPLVQSMPLGPTK